MILVALALSEEELAPLLMPPLAFAGVAAALFVVLAIAVWSYRDVSNRHRKTPSGHDSHSAGH